MKCFYDHANHICFPDNDDELLIIQADRGSTQGCGIGTPAYNLGQGRSIKGCIKRHPDVVFRFITDDVRISGPAAKALAALQDLQAVLRKDYGIEMNPKKCHLVVGPECDITTSNRQGFPDDFKISKINDHDDTGALSLYVPSGLDVFVDKALREIVNRQTQLLRRIQFLEEPSQQYQLLRWCSTPRLNY